MSKICDSTIQLTTADLKNLPPLIGSDTVAALRHSSRRGVQRQYKELGGIKIDGKILFPTHKVLADLHLV